jgi:hypothetical protein
MRVVPSDVVRQIERFFPNTKFDPTKNLGLSSGHRLHFASILQLVERIPEDLITLSAEDFCALQTAVASMRCQIDFWHAHGDQHVEPVPGLTTDFVTLVHSLLSKCPDQAPASTTTGLDFLTDETQRQDLRTDKSDADRALSNGEWKAATVLSGSLVEALLLWALQRKDKSDIDAAVVVVKKGNTKLPRAGQSLDDWNLHEYIEVSAELGVIGETTAKQCRLAKGFRNLIHPGAERRRAEKCGRAEALAGASAVEHVIRDLSG